MSKTVPIDYWQSGKTELGLRALILALTVHLFIIPGNCPAFQKQHASVECSGTVISTGSSMSDVLDMCGYPDQVETFYEMPGVLIEDWRYNKGPARPGCYLRFQDGVLRGVINGVAFTKH